MAIQNAISDTDNETHHGFTYFEFMVQKMFPHRKYF